MPLDGSAETALDHKSAAQLACILSEIREAHSRYKRMAEATHKYMIEMGLRLIEAKEIVGHNRFMMWVEQNCPFRHRTANNYMKVAQSNLGFARVANLAEEGTIDAVERHLHRKGAAKLRHQKAKEEAEEKAERSGIASSSARSRWGKRKKAPTFTEYRASLKSERLRQSEDAVAVGKADPHREWPRPKEDDQALVVKWHLDDGSGQIIYVWIVYVWLPANAHAEALAAIAGATHGRWSGAAALRYRWLSMKHGDRSCDRPQVHQDLTWEQVLEHLRRIANELGGDGAAEILDRDSARTEILDLWHFREEPKAKRRAD